MADALIHGLVLIFKLHYASKTLHEEFYGVSESLFQLLVVAHELKHGLTELCAGASRQVDSLLHLLCEISVLTIDDLHKGRHQRVQWVRAIQLVLARELTHERDVVGSQHLQLIYDLTRLLVSNLELVDLKSLPCVYFLWLFYLLGGLCCAGPPAPYTPGGLLTDIASLAQFRLIVKPVEVYLLRNWLYLEHA